MCRYLLNIFDTLIGIRHYDEDARRVLRRSFWIGASSIFNLSEKAARRAIEANQREWKAYWDRRHTQECPPTDYDGLLRKACAARGIDLDKFREEQG